MKKIIGLLLIVLCFTGCTFLIIDKASIGTVAEADIENAEIKTVIDMKDKK